jgi:hypothetical protein
MSTWCCAEQTCGTTLVFQSFDQYSGPPQNYTDTMIRADFPQGAKVLYSLGQLKATGFSFAKGYGRAAVGDGALRTTHEQGVSDVSGQRALHRSCLF